MFQNNFCLLIAVNYLSLFPLYQVEVVCGTHEAFILTDPDKVIRSKNECPLEAQLPLSLEAIEKVTAKLSPPNTPQSVI